MVSYLRQGHRIQHREPHSQHREHRNLEKKINIVFWKVKCYNKYLHQEPRTLQMERRTHWRFRHHKKVRVLHSWPRRCCPKVGFQTEASALKISVWFVVVGWI